MIPDGRCFFTPRVNDSYSPRGQLQCACAEKFSEGEDPGYLPAAHSGRTMPPKTLLSFTCSMISTKLIASKNQMTSISERVKI